MMMIRNIKRFFEMHGLGLLLFIKSLLQLPKFIKNYNAYKSQQDDNFPIKITKALPVLNDYTDSAGVMKGHYVHQDLWAAQKIYEANPKRHIDIGSRIDGFITSLLAHRTVEVVDIRPLTTPYENLVFIQDDATQMKSFKENELESVSCLHAMEHFGLGRYGDPVQPNAYKEFAGALTRTIKKNGTLYLSVPIGKQRLEFNAHRIFSPQGILDLFSDFKLKEFSAVDDNGDFIKQCAPQDFSDARFSCGLFEFQKK